MSIQSQSRTSALRRLLLTACAGCVLTLPAAISLHAQTDSARIAGSVTDQSGALIPGATVTVTNTQTNAVSIVTSGRDGNFTVSALPPGTYRAEVKQSGFATQVDTFTLDVSQVQALNFKLTVGDAAVSVDVTDAAPI